MQEDLFWGNKENAEDQTWRTQTSSEEGQNRIAVHAHETQHEINLDGAEVKRWKPITVRGGPLKPSKSRPAVKQ